MRYLIRLELQSPLMVGGKKFANQNYQKSLGYIPGSVLRAAFAREIVRMCGCSAKRPEDGKRYWVEYRGEPCCESCRTRVLCEKFGDAAFGTLYPSNSKPYPNTNMRCKYEKKHRNADTLLFKLNRHLGKLEGLNEKCNDNGCGERLEKHQGLHREGQDVENLYSLITRTAISPFRKSSKAGYLYSMDVLAETSLAGDAGSRNIFEGYIEVPSAEDALDGIGGLRVGAETGCGYGKCRVSYERNIQEDDIQKLKTRVQEFNKQIFDKKRVYLSCTLDTNTYLLNMPEGFDRGQSPAQVSTDGYKRIYADALKKYIPSGLQLEMVFAENEVLRGFDTAKPEKWLRNSKIVTKAGSIFVFSTAREDMDYLKLLEFQRKGIGEHTKHGFGSFTVCDEFHYKYAMQTGGDLNE